MDAPQDVLLPILLATIIANAAIIVLLLASGRIGRRKPAAASGSHAAAFDHTLMSSSFRDRPGSSTWPLPDAAPMTDGEADAGDEPDDLARDAGDLDAAPAVFEPIPARAAPARTGELPRDGEPPRGPIAEEPTFALVDDLATDEGVDALTGLPDGSAFSRIVADEDARIARYHHPATVVIFELGGFDRLIERLGHDAGDRIIPAVADTIRRLARSADHVARLGPVRFATLLPETDEVAAINYIERVRAACELWLESGSIALRLAIGWAGTTGDPTLPDAERLALDRMYAELRRGARRAGSPDDTDRIAS